VILSRLTLIVAIVMLVDHGIKFAMRRHLGARAASLGVLGHLRIVSATTWLERVGADSSGFVIPAAWLASATALVIVTAGVPETGLFAGLLLGGSLSHLIERWLRGSVTDYVCLHFWPAFNAADVAITVGAFGLMATIIAERLV
jgi:lipoprotein signal peptidase